MALALFAFGAYALWDSLAGGYPGVGQPRLGILVMIVGALTLACLYTLQPNEAAIMQLFGAYKGTSRVPACARRFRSYARKISLRARNLNGDKLKVNDKRGNPIEIAAVVVWHVEDSAKAAFDVDDYEMFVKVQSESAVRHLAIVVRLRRRGKAGRHARADAAGKRRRGRARAGQGTAGAARRRPAWSSRRRASRTWPMRRRSPR